MVISPRRRGREKSSEELVQFAACWSSLCRYQSLEATLTCTMLMRKPGSSCQSSNIDWCLEVSRACWQNIRNWVPVERKSLPLYQITLTQKWALSPSVRLSDLRCLTVHYWSCAELQSELFTIRMLIFLRETMRRGVSRLPYSSQVLSYVQEVGKS